MKITDLMLQAGLSHFAAAAGKGAGEIAAEWIRKGSAHCEAALGRAKAKAKAEVSK